METLQHKIINELGVKPEIDPVEEIADRTLFLEQYLDKSGMNGYVLGISGGQDSLLAGMLAQRAVMNLHERTGKNVTFHPVLLPYGTQTDRYDAELACKVIDSEITPHDFDIRSATDALAKTFASSENLELSDYHKGNVKARMRMIAQYAIAGQYGLLVIGTDHAAEAAVGFFTKFGDGGADVLPLSGLNKRQGRQLLQELGAPKIFVSKRPTADLLDNKPAQADEDELGLTYDQLDDYLEGKKVSTSVASRIEQHFLKTEHKRSLPRAYTDLLIAR